MQRTLAMSATHTCAQRAAGLFCWGSNFAGELGNGDMQEALRPVQATLAGGDIVELGANSGRTCVRRSDGQVACWGLNEQGQIGDGTRVASLSPQPAVGIVDAEQLSVGNATTCVLHGGGMVSCWGGAHQNHPEYGSLVPQPIPGLPPLVELQTGVDDSYCGRADEGGVWCWKLLEGRWTPPASVADLAPAQDVAMMGHAVVCAITESGVVACHNLENGRTTPLQQSEGSVELVGTTLVAAARDEAGTWQVWNVLPIMLESIGSYPLALPIEGEFKELAVGGLSACVLRLDDAVLCANANDQPLEGRVVEGLPP